VASVHGEGVVTSSGDDGGLQLSGRVIRRRGHNAKRRPENTLINVGTYSEREAATESKVYILCYIRIPT